LLTAVCLPKLITHSVEQYEELAVELANQPKKLNDIKNTLNANKQNAPLFNSGLTTQKIEAAYKQMMMQKSNHSPLANIAV